ncbi:MAG: GIY-YIG nuclease family protein [Gracilimonas sp.]|nr:GIY-YIG nuclease family protein [Gracilimonas sp.]
MPKTTEFSSMWQIIIATKIYISNTEKTDRFIMQQNWVVYMIRCVNGSIYTGCTNHLIRRWNQHIQGKGAKYLKAHTPKEIVFVEPHPNQSEACSREYEIKQFPKHKKEALIEEN